MRNRKNNLPSLLMPTAMHFFNRQYWHRFLLILRMEHCWFLVQGLYWIFCWMERRKKPWGSQRQLESLSVSELSSLEQPESLESRSLRASSMLTSTECRSRSSAPHAMPLNHSTQSLAPLKPPRSYTVRPTDVTDCSCSLTRCTGWDGGCRWTVRALRAAAHSYRASATYLPAADPTEKVRVPPAPARRPLALLTVLAALECAAAAAPVRRI
ncbi:hypothetical protein O0L34_g7070 [Tuta absoluta]|nr:hypothetical protein O0L34_g7070 [Tuta absoluta]